MLSIDGKTYDVRYELYRAFFLTYKNQVDGGNSSVWTSDEKDVYVEKINDLILNRITEIYSAFAICERIDFDIYSSSVEKKIKENIKTISEYSDLTEKEKIEIKALKKGECLMFAGDNHILAKIEAADFEKEIIEEKNNEYNNSNK